MPKSPEEMEAMLEPYKKRAREIIEEAKGNPNVSMHNLKLVLIEDSARRRTYIDDESRLAEEGIPSSEAAPIDDPSVVDKMARKLLHHSDYSFMAPPLRANP